MRKFKTPNRKQLLMLVSVNLEEAAPEGSAARIIDGLVEELDTSSIEEKYDFEAIQGKEPIHPKTLLKIVLFGIYNCRFSLRKMEDDTVNNLAYRWLTGDCPVDHSTLGKFLSRFKEEIVELFSQVVAIGRERGLIDFDLLAIDSVKIRADASCKQFRTLEGLEKEKNKIRKKLSELLERADNEETKEEEKRTLERRRENLNEARAELHRRIEELKLGLSEKKAAEIEEKTKINVTDHDCILVQQANGEINAGYSITTTVDGATDFVTHLQVNEQNNDAETLLPAIHGSEKKTGRR